jgi:acetyl esterase
MPLSTDTEMFVKSLENYGAKPFHEGTPEEARMTVASLLALAEKKEKKFKILDIYIGENEIRLRITYPVCEPKAIIFYCHGGGWVCGTADQYDAVAQEISLQTSCAVVVVEYRLAPENKYPIPFNDCWDAISWVDENKGKVNLEGLSLIIGGDSSGGNLAASLTLLCVDKGIDIALQILIYPVTQYKPNTPSYIAEENQILVSAKDMEWFWNNYTDPYIDRNQPSLSPVNSHKLSSLPPTLIISAEYDVVRDENRYFSKLLVDAGVSVEYIEMPGEIHAFFNMIGLISNSKKAIQSISIFINENIK